MAFSLDSLLESVVPAIITGGGTALSTIYAYFKDLRKRLDDIEKRVGSIDSKTGLAYSLNIAEDTLRQIQTQVNQLRTQVDEAVHGRWQQGGRIPTLTGMDGQGIPSLQVIEQAIQAVKGLDQRVREMEDRCDRIENKFKRLVTEEDFEQSDRQRAEEISTVRTTLAEVKGLLQGLQSALGLIKSNR